MVKINLKNIINMFIVLSLNSFLIPNAFSETKYDALIDQSRQELESPKHDIRIAAVERLERLAPVAEPAVTVLISALRHYDSSIRMAAAHALGATQDSRATDALISALTDSASSVRIEAADRLTYKKDNDRATEAMISALKDSDSGVRMMALKALGHTIDSRATEALILALKESDSNVRMRAAEGLVYKTSYYKAIDSRVDDILMSAFKNKELDVVAGAHIYFIKKSVDGSESILRWALNDYGSKEMAVRFLNCGNKILEIEANYWLKKHGFYVYSMPVANQHLRWGGTNK